MSDIAEKEQKRIQQMEADDRFQNLEALVSEPNSLNY